MVWGLGVLQDPNVATPCTATGPRRKMAVLLVQLALFAPSPPAGNLSLALKISQSKCIDDTLLRAGI